MKVLCSITGDLLPADLRKKDDFNWTEPGEIVDVGSVCDGHERYRTSCGCGRAFSGFETGRATTYATVVELPTDEVHAAYVAGLKRSGYDAIIDAAEGWAEFCSVYDDCLKAHEIGTIVRTKNGPNGSRYTFYAPL